MAGDKSEKRAPVETVMQFPPLGDKWGPGVAIRRVHLVKNVVIGGTTRGEIVMKDLDGPAIQGSVSDFVLGIERYAGGVLVHVKRAANQSETDVIAIPDSNIIDMQLV